MENSVTQEPIFVDAQAAFERAIERGDLSTVQADTHYAGNYMYMYSTDSHHFFKHIDTRKYTRSLR